MLVAGEVRFVGVGRHTGLAFVLHLGDSGVKLRVGDSFGAWRGYNCDRWWGKCLGGDARKRIRVSQSILNFRRCIT